MDTKVCCKCKKKKPISKFHKSSQNKDGLCSYCKSCNYEYSRKWRESNLGRYRELVRNYNYRSGRSTPLGENSDCSSYLGIYITERVLSKIFKNVERMPTNNPGYDFICNRGYKVDVKSATRMKNSPNTWRFNIKKNTIADYFLCLAFDNRDDLEPEHLWLIPGSILNNKVSTSISESTLINWNQYELNNKLNNVIRCCNILKEE